MLIFNPLGEATSSKQTLDQSLKIVAFGDPEAKLIIWPLKFCLLRVWSYAKWITFGQYLLVLFSQGLSFTHDFS